MPIQIPPTGQREIEFFTGNLFRGLQLAGQFRGLELEEERLKKRNIQERTLEALLQQGQFERGIGRSLGGGGPLPQAPTSPLAGFPRADLERLAGIREKIKEPTAPKTPTGLELIKAGRELSISNPERGRGLINKGLARVGLDPISGDLSDRSLSPLADAIEFFDAIDDNVDYGNPTEVAAAKETARRRLLQNRTFQALDAQEQRLTLTELRKTLDDVASAQTKDFAGQIDKALVSIVDGRKKISDFPSAIRPKLQRELGESLEDKLARIRLEAGAKKGTAVDQAQDFWKSLHKGLAGIILGASTQKWSAMLATHDLKTVNALRKRIGLARLVKKTDNEGNVVFVEEGSTPKDSPIRDSEVQTLQTRIKGAMDKISEAVGEFFEFGEEVPAEPSDVPASRTPPRSQTPQSLTTPPGAATSGAGRGLEATPIPTLPQTGQELQGLPTTLNTPQAVRDAYQSGQITLEQARQLIRELGRLE